MNIPFSTTVFSNLLHLITGQPLNPLSAMDRLTLDSTLTVFSLSQHLRAAISDHIARTQLWVAPSRVSTQAQIVDASAVVRRC